MFVEGGVGVHVVIHFGKIEPNELCCDCPHDLANDVMPTTFRSSQPLQKHLRSRIMHPGGTLSILSLTQKVQVCLTKLPILSHKTTFSPAASLCCCCCVDVVLNKLDN